MTNLTNILGSVLQIVIPIQPIQSATEQLISTANPTVKNLLDLVQITITTPISLPLIFNAQSFSISWSELEPILSSIAQSNGNILSAKDVIFSIPGISNYIDSDTLSTMASGDLIDSYISYDDLLSKIKPSIKPDGTIDSSKLLLQIPGTFNMLIGQIFGHLGINFPLNPSNLLNQLKGQNGQMQLENIFGSIINSSTGGSFLDAIKGGGRSSSSSLSSSNSISSSSSISTSSSSSSSGKSSGGLLSNLLFGSGKKTGGSSQTKSKGLLGGLLG